MDSSKPTPALRVEDPQFPPRARGNTSPDQPEGVCRVHVGVPNGRLHTEDQARGCA